MKQYQQLMFLQKSALHFTGIGGIGMSGLAEIYHALGCVVSGSDLKLSGVTQRLESLGIRITKGHSASNLPTEASALIVTSAVQRDNPEIVEARRRGLPVVMRGELLAELMRTRRGVAFGGSHGKTTSSSMAACVALHAAIDPTVFIGTLAPFLGGSNARLGGDLLITECDESDGSFLQLAPLLSVITNIDREHLDHYKTFENLQDAFVQFANNVAWYGAAIICVDDPHVRSLQPHMRRRLIRYGLSDDAGLRIHDAHSDATGSNFRLTRGGEELGEFHLRVLGTHNVLNATAVVAAMLELAVPLEEIRTGLAEYRGTGRRMEIKGSAAGVTVIDDYGHHPTEVRATLAALRLMQPKRLVVIFQPHRFTRTQLLMDEFAGAFRDADLVRVMEIYAASEPPLAGVTAAALVTRIRATGHAACALDGGVEQLKRELHPGDLVLTLGAGSVTQMGPRLLDELRKG